MLGLKGDLEPQVKVTGETMLDRLIVVCSVLFSTATFNCACFYSEQCLCVDTSDRVICNNYVLTCSLHYSKYASFNC